LGRRGQRARRFGRGRRGEGAKRSITYQACINPGTNPRQQSAMLMSESAVQMPHLIQTAIGGKRMARRVRGRSEVHILWVCELSFGGLRGFNRVCVCMCVYGV